MHKNIYSNGPFVSPKLSRSAVETKKENALTREKLTPDAIHSLSRRTAGRLKPLAIS